MSWLCHECNRGNPDDASKCVSKGCAGEPLLKPERKKNPQGQGFEEFRLEDLEPHILHLYREQFEKKQTDPLMRLHVVRALIFARALRAYHDEKAKGSDAFAERHPWSEVEG